MKAWRSHTVTKVPEIEIASLDERYAIYYVDYDIIGFPHQRSSIRKSALTQYIKDAGLDVGEYKYSGDIEQFNIDPATLLSEEAERIIKLYLQDQWSIKE